MFGKNPKRPPEKGDGQLLQVQEVFPTLQGEGPYAGWPAVFLRLGGCNLACGFCDTEFESFQPVALAGLVERVRQLALNIEGRRVRHLVVVTGGEPLRQPIAPLCEALLAEGFRVQLESNGTLWRPLPEAVELICSPKRTEQGYHPLRDDVLQRATALKFLISAAMEGYGTVPEVGQSAYPDLPVYLQPMDEYDEATNRRNREHAVALAESGGYRLSLQLHKWLGIA